jgi:DNA-binding beta-propeller fold protein YncE
MRSLVLSLLLAASPALPLAAQAASASPSASYHVARRIRLGGDGGWDYLTVDTVAHRLYVARSTHVLVVDTDGDSLVGDIPSTPGVHGVTPVPALHEGFATDGRDSSVTVFDLASLEKTALIHVGAANPDGALYDPGSRRLFTFDGGSANATAIDPATHRVVGTVALGGKPEAAQADGGRIYVNLEDRSEVAVFDPATLALLARWPLAPCEEPTAMGIDRARHRLYVGCGGNGMLAVVDDATGRVLATVPTGSGIDGAGFDPATGAAFTSNGGDGTLSVVREVRPGEWAVTGTVRTMRGARTMTVDERTHRIYTASAELGAPPAPTPERPHPRPSIVPGTFTLLVIEP